MVPDDLTPGDLTDNVFGPRVTTINGQQVTLVKVITQDFTFNKLGSTEFAEDTYGLHVIPTAFV